MPQMMPIWWVLVCIMSSLFILCIYISLYFFFMNENSMNYLNKMDKKLLMIDDL